jgi:uncharacterized protein YdeI (YjbR/CyaY-like superfamily)
MAAVVPDPKRIRSFADVAAFERWLAEKHATEPELWIKMHKKGSGLASITWIEAVQVCLCWGWIDGIRKSFDEQSFLQRYTPRRPKSIWSQVNRDHVERLISEGRMTEHGLAHVEAAKRDGRWQNAYAPQRSTTLPDDLAAAIAASKKATATLAKLDRVNRFALSFRVQNMKTAAGRQRKIEQLVALLKKGEGPLGKPSGKAKAPKASG